MPTGPTTGAGRLPVDPDLLTDRERVGHGRRRLAPLGRSFFLRRGFLLRRRRRSHIPLLVGLEHGVGDSSTAGDPVAVLPGPLPNRCRVLAVARDRAHGSRRGSGGGGTLTATASPSCSDERSQGLAQLRRVLARQVDLVLAPCESEGHRLVGFGTIQVVDKPGFNVLRHGHFRSVRSVQTGRYSPENAENVKLA